MLGALIILARLPRQSGFSGASRGDPPELSFEQPFGLSIPSLYALAARRHMYEYGTTSAQLAEIKVAASLHAQHNPNALLQNVVTVDEVLDSPMISDPFRTRLDCCVITDGGGALVVVSPEVARSSRSSLPEGAWSRGGTETPDEWPARPRLHRGGLLRPAGVRRSRGDDGRHRLRLDL